MKFTSIFAVFVLIISGQLFAETYYVAPDGNNDDQGSIDAPWRTISMATQNLQPGDTVFIREGTYREVVNPITSGTEAEPIVYSAFPNERVIINGTRVVTDWERDGDGNRYRAQVNFAAYPRFNSGRDPNGNRGGLLLQDGAKMNYVMAPSAEEVDEPGEYYINDAEGQNPPFTLYVNIRDLGRGTDPNEYLMEMGGSNHGLNLDGGEDYLIFRNLEVYGWNGSCVSSIDSDYCTFDGLKCYSAYITGIYLKQRADHNEILNCEFWDNGHGGIEMAGAHFNRVHHCNFTRRDMGDGHGGNGAHIWIGPVGQNGDDNIVEFNTAFRTSSGYISSCFISITGSRNIIRRNSVIDYNMAGIALSNGADNVITGNIIYRTFGPCIRVFPAAVIAGGNVIRFNDFYSAGIGTSFGWGDQWYDDIEVWERTSGQSDNFDTNPRCVAPFEEDMALTIDSPCIDTGDPEGRRDPDGTRADVGTFYFHQRDIDVNPIDLQFEPIPTGQIDSSSFVIRNTGGTPLTITGFLWAENVHPFFTREGDEPFEIEPRGEYIVWVFFAPDETGDWNAWFILESDDPDEGEIVVSMSGSALYESGNDPHPPREFGITQIYPNPFNSSTTICYSLATKSRALLQIYNTNGQLVITLVDQVKRGGVHSAIWDGRRAAAGVYLVRLNESVRKVVVMR